MGPILLDTNVLVSALLLERSIPAHIVKAWREGRFQVVVCEHLIAEAEKVLKRHRITHFRDDKVGNRR